MLETFMSRKMVAYGERDVEVVRFNGMMAICGDDEGAVIITKEQVMKFFDLKENK